MKPTGTFKLSKTTKCLMALGKFTSQDQRMAFKAMMIQAQMASEVKFVRTKERVPAQA